MQEIYEIPCPCHSGKTYKNCCKPLHQGSIAENALQLMRSRFSAYALHLPLYILQTTHPANPQYFQDSALWIQNISQFCLNSKFQKLEILDFKEQENLAVVTFVAHLIQKDQKIIFTEKSLFEKVKNRWLYRNGQVAKGYDPNLITPKHVKLLSLAYYGNPILRKKASPITEKANTFSSLIENMIEAMDANDGIGLAAPQIHQSLQLFIFRMPTEVKNGRICGGKARVMINPKISSSSQETWKAIEGCLSIPSIYGSVERSKEITVEYTNLEGERVSEHCVDWQARILLHEMDHLEGVLFIDHLAKEEKEKVEPLLQDLQTRLQTLP